MQCDFVNRCVASIFTDDENYLKFEFFNISNMIDGNYLRDL